MKIKKSLQYFFYLTPAILVILISACAKQNAYAMPNYTSTTDSLIYINALRKLHVTGNVESLKRSWIIEGIVIANDEHDNIYKSIILQDSTGGIVVLLDGTNLYQLYPIGAGLRIRVQNLFLTDYRKMQQLAASIDTSSGSLSASGIPIPLFDKHISTMKSNLKVSPLEVTYKMLSDTLQGRLIRLSNVELAATDTNQTYADKKNKVGISRSLKFCSGGTIYLRTSGYADFAGINTPSGNGQVVGVYSVYNSEKQLLIRDTSDILLKGKRCTGVAWLQNLPQ